MGDGALMMVVLLGGGVLMCSLCSAGLFVLYRTNPGLFDGLFGAGKKDDDGGGGEGISSSAGKYVCPMPYTRGGEEFVFTMDSENEEQGKDIDHKPGFVRKWCKADGFHRVLASKLPADAKPGEIFDPPKLQKRGGIYGPKIGGFNPYKPEDTYVYFPFKYLASTSTKAPK